MRTRTIGRLFSFMLAAGSLALLGAAQVDVVNMIPATQSGETNQDSEPNLTVDPRNALNIVGSAFTPDPAQSANAPIYVSTDGGQTWAWNLIVPSQAGAGHNSGTGDITVRFSSNALYAGILRNPGTFRLNILRTSNFTGAGAMTVLVDRTNVDQPYVQAHTALGGAGGSDDHVYVGDNDFSGPGGRTATIDQSMDAATAPAPAGLSSARLEARTTMGQDGPPIRTAVHPSGVIYAGFYRWTAAVGTFSPGGTITADVVVVRDDDWGSGATPYTDLAEPPAPTGDGLAGVRIVTGRTVPWFNQVQANFGQERFVGSNLSIAVDPRDDQTVYLAWADRVGATDYTLHVRRSTDGGQNWSGDLRTVTNAINPALAINSRGRVGFLYQLLLTAAGGAQTWETHLERTDNTFGTIDDQVLARVPAGTPAPQFIPYIGDYAHLLAHGKNFHGIFSANNRPVNANFPNGVTYNRNVDFTTNVLLANDGVTPVGVSIDPFYFQATELAANEDFYCRDWTNTPADRDLGLEPSTDPSFYSRPDVWNRRSDAAGGFDANDRPQSQDPQPSTLGGNFAFARVHRTALGPARNVDLHFLVSELGTGSNYQDAGATADPSLSFSTTDDVLTMTSGYPWQLSAAASTHTCLAVELATAQDPLVLPSLVGRAPGWPTTDLMVLNDNNKAQRNMGVHTGGAGGAVRYFAVAHNAALFRRDMVIRYRMDSRVFEKTRGLKIEVIGDTEDGGRWRQFGDLLTLEGMAPCENRWIVLSFETIGARPGDELAIEFDEIVNGRAVNGFRLGTAIDKDERLAADNLRLHAAVFERVAELYGLDAARGQSERASEYLAKEAFRETDYGPFAKACLGPVGELVKRVLETGGKPDMLGSLGAFEEWARAVAGGNPLEVLSAHNRFLHTFDATLTWLSKQHGDVADILQTVSWQERLFREIEELAAVPDAKLIVARSRAFIEAYGRRAIGNDGYSTHVKEVLEALGASAGALESRLPAARAAVAALEERLAEAPDLAGLQQTHCALMQILSTLEP